MMIVRLSSTMSGHPTPLGETEDQRKRAWVSVWLEHIFGIKRPLRVSGNGVDAKYNCCRLRILPPVPRYSHDDSCPLILSSSALKLSSHFLFPNGPWLTDSIHSLIQAYPCLSPVAQSPESRITQTRVLRPPTPRLQLWVIGWLGH